MTFHTGNPLTAEAAKAAIERTMEIGEGAAYIWGAVKKIDAPDDTTLVFHLSYPSPLDLVSSGTYSAYIYDTTASSGQDLGDWFADGNDAGTGPYMVSEYNPGDEIELRLEAYPDYWGGWDDADHYERYVFRVTPEANTAAQLLRAGEVSMVQRMSPQLWASFEGQDGFETESAPSWQTLLGMLNTADGPLADPQVRDAVTKAIDYNGMIAALEGAADPLSGVVPPGLWGHTDGLEYQQNVDEARTMLEQAGFGPSGEPIDLSLTYLKGDADEELVATLMKSNLADLNINLDVRGLQWQTQWDQGKSANAGRAAGHLHLLLVAGLPGPGVLVLQPVPHRAGAVLQPRRTTRTPLWTRTSTRPRSSRPPTVTRRSRCTGTCSGSCSTMRRRSRCTRRCTSGRCSPRSMASWTTRPTRTWSSATS